MISAPHADDAALIRAIEQTYGSLASPHYGFVAETLQTRPYRGLVARLGHVFDVEETTDSNDDVSFRYVLTDGVQTWAFDASMVGPYGLLIRLDRGRPDEVVTQRSAASSALEAELVTLIERAGIRLLSRDVLERTVPLRRLNVDDDDDQTRMYHALISDEPLLPWQIPG